MPKTSIVIPSHNEGNSLFLTVEALLQTSPPGTEIILVNDDSHDGSFDFLADGPWPGVRRIDLPRRGISEARNEGARHATGEVLVFLDAHCAPKAGWLPPLLAELDHHPRSLLAPAISVLGQTSAKGYGLDLVDRCFHYRWRTEPESPDPHPVPIACGCCLVVRRDFFFEISAFDSMRTFGLEDLEISLRAWLMGGSVRLVPGSEVAHRFKATAQYHVAWRDFVYNRLRVATLHFDGERLERILARLQEEPNFDEALALLRQSDIFDRRASLAARKTRTADWFCDHFAVNL